jgi:flagellar hook-basal body complex protein FliE
MSPLSALSLPTTTDTRSLASLLTGKNAVTAPTQAELKTLTSQLSQTASVTPPGIEKLGGSAAVDPSITTVETGGGSFSNTLKQFVSEVNTKQVDSSKTVNELLSGGNVSLHQAMIAMEEANVSFQLMIEVRNKLLDSYQELMRMQV